MTDDIVARLRDCTCVPHGEICREAADEIERLRKGGCARDQRTTQFCAEAVELQREVERLRNRLLAEENSYDILRLDNEHLQADRNNLALEVERLRTELQESENLLDEYRREAVDRTRWENTDGR